MAEPSLLLEAPKKTKRIVELDALRAIAALNLLLFHFTYVYQNKYGFSSPLGFSFPYGKYGVELFFILSGFVNAMTLLRKRQPKEFVVGRFIRIFPSYWLVILLNVVLFSMFAMYGTAPTMDATLANATIVPNLLGYDCMEPVTWTLQIEMLFYGFLLIMLITKGIDRPFPILMTGIAVSLVACTSFDAFRAANPDSIWAERMTVVENMLILRWFPLFAMGMLINEFKSKRGNRYVLAGGMIASAVVFHAIDVKDHNPLATLLLFGLVAFSAYGKIPLLRIKPLVFISTISYSLYLFHNNLGVLIIAQLDSLGMGPMLSTIVATIFAIVVSVAITYWFEQPITKYLRARWADYKAWKLSLQNITPRRPAV